MKAGDTGPVWNVAGGGNGADFRVGIEMEWAEILQVISKNASYAVPRFYFHGIRCVLFFFFFYARCYMSAKMCQHRTMYEGVNSSWLPHKIGGTEE